MNILTNRFRIPRREILQTCIGRGLLVAAAPMSANSLLALWQQGEVKAMKPTATEVLGPFYRKGAPSQTALRVAGEPGFPLRVTGKVVNTRGEKIPGARVDIWHADHKGFYDLDGFRYRSKLIIESQADYAIDTIMPGHYDDRPAQHIHYMVTAPGHRTLITQAYFATDPFFEGDPDKNFKKRGMASSRDLVRTVTLYEQPGEAHAAITFDIILEKA